MLKRKQSIPHLRNEIKAIANKFGNAINAMIREIKSRKKESKLSGQEINKISAYHNSLRKQAEDKISRVISMLPEGTDFEDSFYDGINNLFRYNLEKLEMVLY